MKTQKHHNQNSLKAFIGYGAIPPSISLIALVIAALEGSYAGVYSGGTFMIIAGSIASIVALVIAIQTQTMAVFFKGMLSGLALVIFIALGFS